MGYAADEIRKAKARMTEVRKKMDYTIKEYSEYNRQEIINLYQSVGWQNYVEKPDMLENAYKNSLKIYGAYVKEKLIGIIRVVGDGYSVVFIQDILILPEFQRKGIGTALLKKILTEYADVYQKHLLTDDTEKTIQFYKSLGFMMDTDIECRAFSKFY